MVRRIGFCCKWLDEHGTTDDKTMNTRATTVTWLKRQTKADAEARLLEILEHNLTATLNLVKTVGEMDENLRMVRLGSDILPVYTEPNFGYFYNDPVIQTICETGFAAIGDVARSRDVRLSFHPGQFTVLASDRPDVVDKSVEEFEYHVDMARWMGYGRSFQDFKINVHISGRLGPDGIRAVLNRLSTEARNTITIENEEYKYGLDDCLTLADVVPIVLDLHHHWIRENDYIRHDDERISRVLDSWRGVRPVLHYSVSREGLLREPRTVLESVRPEMTALLESGHKKGDLRAHSDFMWNRAVNDYAKSFWPQFDIQCESKAKNLASAALFAELSC